MPNQHGPNQHDMSTARSNDYLTRAEALALLQIKLQTLYAYVSRGWIRSTPHGAAGRRLYARLDVERVKARADARRGHAPVAAGAMRWGDPIIPSTITEITDAGPRYRGIPALDLACQAPGFERVAEHLWAARDAAAHPWRPCQQTLRFADALALAGQTDPRRELVRFLADVALSFRREPRRRAVGAEFLPGEARCLIATMAHCLWHLQALTPPRRTPQQDSIATTLLACLGTPLTPPGAAAINTALILCADHELAQATFVARIAASAGADLGECIGAAILTQTGMTAARSYERAEDFLRSCRSPAQAHQRFAEQSRANRSPPGFNHPLYPGGDPRAARLVETARRCGTASRTTDLLYLVLDIAAGFGYLPSLEAGLTVLACALGLPPRSPCGLFVVGRIAGWVAHVMEQRLSGELLRPRAQYTPAMPPPAATYRSAGEPLDPGRSAMPPTAHYGKRDRPVTEPSHAASPRAG